MTSRCEYTLKVGTCMGRVDSASTGPTWKMCVLLMRAPLACLLAPFCSNTYWCVSGWFYSVWNSNNKGIKTVHSCTGGAVQQQAKVNARQRRRTHTQQIEQMEQQQLNNNIMAEVMKLERTSKSTKQTNTRARFRSTRSLFTSAYQTITFTHISK